MSVKTYSKNILERGVTTLTAGTAHADFPPARLYDRNISDLFKTTAAVTTTIHVDQVNGLNSNYGFETGDFTGWSQLSAAISTAQKHTGTYSAKLTASGSVITGPATNDIIIDSTKTYAMSAWLWVENYVAGSARCSWHVKNKAGTEISQGFFPAITANSTVWENQYYTIGPSGSGADITFPAGSYSIFLRLDATTTPTLDVYIDDAYIYELSDIISIDTFIVPTGHSLYGETIDIQHSVDNVNWVDAVSQFIGDPGQMIKTLTGGLKRWWRITITSPAEIVSIPEIFMSPAYAWEADPSYPLESIEDKFNVEKITTLGGRNHYLKRGEAKRVRKYTLKNILTAQKDNLLGIWSDWSGYKPFWLLDHEGSLFFAEIEGQIDLGGEIYGVFESDIMFVEVLT